MKTQLSSQQVTILNSIYCYGVIDERGYIYSIPDIYQPLCTGAVYFEEVLNMMPKAIHHAEDDADRYKLEIRHLEDEWFVCYANNESEYLPFIREELIDALFCVLVDIRIHEFIPAL